MASLASESNLMKTAFLRLFDSRLFVNYNVLIMIRHAEFSRFSNKKLYDTELASAAESRPSQI
jgi:hypothetical protein